MHTVRAPRSRLNDTNNRFYCKLGYGRHVAYRFLCCTFLKWKSTKNLKEIFTENGLFAFTENVDQMGLSSLTSSYSDKPNIIIVELLLLNIILYRIYLHGVSRDLITTSIKFAWQDHSSPWESLSALSRKLLRKFFSLVHIYIRGSVIRLGHATPRRK